MTSRQEIYREYYKHADNTIKCCNNELKMLMRQYLEIYNCGITPKYLEVAMNSLIEKIHNIIIKRNEAITMRNGWENQLKEYNRGNHETI